MNNQIANNRENNSVLPSADERPAEEIRNSTGDNYSNSDEISVDEEQPESPNSDNNHVTGPTTEGDTDATNNDTASSPGDNDDTTEVTEINVPPSYDNSNYNNPQAHRLWTDEAREAYEERRREALTTELNRVQRTNFIHFSIMCLVPIGLIGLVLMNSFTDNGVCEGFGVAQCERVRRSFLNAFGNDCVCLGITLQD